MDILRSGKSGEVPSCEPSLVSSSITFGVLLLEFDAVAFLLYRDSSDFD